jgi:hypothetical protein
MLIASSVGIIVIDKALQVSNSVIDGCDTHVTKLLICFHVFTLHAFLMGPY